MTTGQPIKIAAVIPARMASSRFPGKPLLKIHGLPMIEHVRRRALLCKGFSEVVVATCDLAIASAVEVYRGRALMTSASHPGALDRVAEAVSYLHCTHVVNVQGDQILVLPEELDLMTGAITTDPETAAWNGVGRARDPGDLLNPSIVKLFVSKSNRVIFCTRKLLYPSLAGDGLEPVRLSVGVMGYSRAFLERYQNTARTPLEVAESIDQFRIIESDETIRTIEFPSWCPDINEPREVEVVEKYLDEDARQKAVLEMVLTKSG